ncbi:MAG: NAD(P)-binding domain-containing protein [Chloroflexota bacterium]|nr:NAD(P)-binding domain-containing protein [Chloroflexota bacterium]
MKYTDLLIIGAGPYGLAVASYVRRLGLECTVVGDPMSFWRDHMPAGMRLRSPTSWHLDAIGKLTFERFLQVGGLQPAEVSPISLGLYLEYAEWFREQSGLAVQQAYVQNLQHSAGGPYPFAATLDDGTEIGARRVLAATGLSQYRNMPDDLAALLPPGSYAHTSEYVDFSPLQGKRCLIVGGRQSAFEWASLINEEDGAKIDLVYRHDTPAFTESDWDWIDELMDRTRESPGWFKGLSPEERDGIYQRLWGEGRLKLEPWLYPLIQGDNVHLWPNTRITGGHQNSDGAVSVDLDNGQSLVVDQVILATGYRVELAREPYLRDTTIVESLDVEEGYPVLDDRFQSSIPGLYFTGQTATRDFGPFFGFGIGCPAAAWVIGNALNR